MKKNAMGNGSTQCILCGDEFGLLGASPTHCDDCKNVSTALKSRNAKCEVFLHFVFVSCLSSQFFSTPLNRISIMREREREKREERERERENIFTLLQTRHYIHECQIFLVLHIAHETHICLVLIQIIFKIINVCYVKRLEIALAM